MENNILVSDNNILPERNVRDLLIGLKGGICTMESSSMSPTIMKGWKTKVIPVAPEKFKIGDIIVFYRDKLICHRLIGKSRNKDGKIFYWEKGDANSTFRMLNDTDIIGKVVEIRDEERRVVKPKHWNKNNLYNLAFIFLYRELTALKKLILKDKRNLITHLFGTVFWKIYNMLDTSRKGIYN